MNYINPAKTVTHEGSAVITTEYEVNEHMKFMYEQGYRLTDATPITIEKCSFDAKIILFFEREIHKNDIQDSLSNHEKALAKKEDLISFMMPSDGSFIIPAGYYATLKNTNNGAVQHLRPSTEDKIISVIAGVNITLTKSALTEQ